MSIHQAAIEKYFPVLLEHPDPEELQMVCRNLDKIWRVYLDPTDREIIINVMSISYLVGRSVGLERASKLYEPIVDGLDEVVVIVESVHANL